MFRAAQGRSRHGVPGNQVHVAEQGNATVGSLRRMAAQQLRQGQRLMRVIVAALEQHILKRDSPPRQGGIFAGRGEQIGKREVFVDRYERAA